MKTSRLLFEHERVAIVALLLLGFMLQAGMTFATDGGDDLLSVYAPGVVGILTGHNPYMTPRPWTTNYQPLFFGLLAIVGALGSLGSHVSLEQVVWSLRIGLIAGHVFLGGLVYLALKKVNVSVIARIAIPGSIVLLPSFLQLGEAWFHGDIFGLLLLCCALLLFQREKWAPGCLLLSISAAFKLHPMLALPLVGLWLYRKSRLTLSMAGALFLPFIALTILPLSYLPGYYDSFVIQNLNARPSWSFSVFIVAYRIVPATLGFEFSTDLVNRVWTFATVALFSILVLFVWKNWQSLSASDIICLGIAVWLIPLKQVFHYYAFWAILPFIFRGRSRQTVLALIPFEVSADLSAYSWAAFPNWTISTDSFMLVLSGADTLLLLLSIFSCAVMVWKTSDARRSVFEEAVQRLTALAEARNRA